MSSIILTLPALAAVVSNLSSTSRNIPADTSPLVFHHDGPFDACAPSRNRVATKAPIKAFNEDEADAIAKSRGHSPLAQATLSAMSADSPYSAVSGSPYPALNGPTLSHQYTVADRAKSPMKSALQEAWGRADPEPFEEFSAGGYSGAPSANNSIKDGVEGNGRAGGQAFYHSQLLTDRTHIHLSYSPASDPSAESFSPTSTTDQPSRRQYSYTRIPQLQPQQSALFAAYYPRQWTQTHQIAYWKIPQDA